MKGLSSKFSGKASGKWVVRLSRYLIVANTHGLLGSFGGTPLPWHPHISMEVTIERERDGYWVELISLKLITVG